MKRKTFALLLLSIQLALITPVVLLAADSTAVATTVTDTGGSSFIENQLVGYFANIGTLAAIVVILVSLVKMKSGLSGKMLQIISWIVSIALSFVGWQMGWGMFEHITVFWTIIAGVLTGLVANGIADLVMVQGLYNFLIDKYKK